MGSCLSLIETENGQQSTQSSTHAQSTQNNTVQPQSGTHQPNIIVTLQENGLVPVERPEFIFESAIEKQDVRTKLENLDPNTVSKIPLHNELTDARIVEVYDGDTVKVIVLFGDRPFFISIRILGIDAPEIKKSKDKLIQEHEAGVRVRDYLKSLLENKVTKVKFQDWDKYGGRILADIFTSDGRSVSEVLIAEGWVRSYNGEKKKEWTLAELTSAPFV